MSASLFLRGLEDAFLKGVLTNVNHIIHNMVIRSEVTKKGCSGPDPPTLPISENHLYHHWLIWNTTDCGREVNPSNAWIFELFDASRHLHHRLSRRTEKLKLFLFQQT